MPSAPFFLMTGIKVMKETINTLSSMRAPFNRVKKTVGIMLIGTFIIFGNYSVASTQSLNTPVKISAPDNKAIFSQALADYFANRNNEAKIGYDRLKNTDYAAFSAVPIAMNLVALGQYSQAKKAFAELKRSENQRDKEYAQLWELWLTAKQWKGSDKDLKKELNRLVNAQIWHLPFEKSIAGLYAGRETVESVFDAVSAFNADAAQHQDALTEAIFFAGGYLQNVKHDNAAARQLFNDNLNKLNSVSLERPFIDRECAALNKLASQSK